MYVLYIVVCLLAIFTTCHSVNEAEQMTTLQIAQNVDTRNESVQECGGVLTDNEGYLISPQFPTSIPSSYTECSWVIRGALHSIVRFRFLIINLPPASPETGQCLGGHVTYGQYDFDGRQVMQNRFCGTEFPAIFVSNRQQAWLTFMSTGTTLKPEIYEGVKVQYTVIDTDFLHNQLIVGIVGGLVVPLSCIVAMTYYVVKVTHRKRREDRAQEYMKMLKYRANDERRERRRLSQLSLPPPMVHPEQHNNDIRINNQCPQTKVEAATKPESETAEEEDDPNNNKIGFSTFLRNIIDSQSTVTSHDATEAGDNTANWSSTHTSASQDRWSFPDSSTGSDHTVVPSTAQSGHSDPVFYLTPDSQGFDLTPKSSLVGPRREKFTVLSPGVSVKLSWSAMQDYSTCNVMKSGGPWEDREFYFPPLDGAGTCIERTSLSSLKRLLTQGVLQANISQSVPDIRTVASTGTNGSKSELNTRCKDRVYLETVC